MDRPIEISPIEHPGASKAVQKKSHHHTSPTLPVGTPSRKATTRAGLMGFRAQHPSWAVVGYIGIDIGLNLNY